jgi:hypothetical protein
MDIRASKGNLAIGGTIKHQNKGEIIK